MTVLLVDVVVDFLHANAASWLWKESRASDKSDGQLHTENGSQAVEDTTSW